jgi:hypothetical protein
VVLVAPTPAAGGWEEDLSKGGSTPGPEAAYTDTDIENLSIDGHHAPFEGKTDGFVQEFYKKELFTLSLYLWDLKSTELASDLFASQKAKDEPATVFTDIPDAPEKAVIGNKKPYWRVFGYKCDYMFEINACVLVQGSLNVCDQTKIETMKADVIAFVQYLTKNLP